MTTAVSMVLTLICFGIYGVCNYRLYKELESNGVPTSLTTAGPGPDVLFRYIVYKRKKGETIGAVCYLGILMLLSACVLMVYTIISAL